MHCRAGGRVNNRSPALFQSLAARWSKCKKAPRIWYTFSYVRRSEFQYHARWLATQARAKGLHNENTNWKLNLQPGIANFPFDAFWRRRMFTKNGGRVIDGYWWSLALRSATYVKGSSLWEGACRGNAHLCAHKQTSITKNEPYTLPVHSRMTKKLREYRDIR